MLLSLLVPSASLCARTAKKTAAPSGPATEQGIASWHELTGPPAGGHTAGSRLWINSELVAAHRTLPLGTKVRVVNLRNQRAVIVEIADRAPYARGRIIDLSVAAAIQLGMIADGVARVRLEPFAVEPATAGVTPLSALFDLLAAPWQGWSFLLTPA